VERAVWRLSGRRAVRIERERLSPSASRGTLLVPNSGDGDGDGDGGDGDGDGDDGGNHGVVYYSIAYRWKKKQ